MRFTWDPAKARKNEKLHGVSFTTAAEIFEDPNHVVGDNYFIEDAGEQRFQIIGMTRKLTLLLVVFVEPASDLIRIISARKAVEYEESIYQDQFR
ncbi:MAG: BrnT family toxin [Acidobacteria bacterium]|nr:BrnT family toxin [Acidobacteriota bacterium]